MNTPQNPMPLWSDHQPVPAPVNTYDNRPAQYKATRPWKIVTVISAVVFVLIFVLTAILGATASPDAPEPEALLTLLGLVMLAGLFGILAGFIGWIVQAVRHPKYVTR